MSYLVDCHSHINEFDNAEIPNILNRALQSEVSKIIIAGTTLETSKQCANMTKEFDQLFCGIGIHPMDIKFPLTEQTITELIKITDLTEKVTVVSEVGLDFLDGMPDREWQYNAFRLQIRMAKTLKLPIIFHSREADNETLRILKEEQAFEVGGAMHYFQGDEALAKKVIDMGFFISLARPLTRLEKLQKVVSTISLDHIVLESDSAPQPFKSKRENWTEPKHIKDIANTISNLHKVDYDEVKRTTCNNILELLPKLKNNYGRMTNA